MTGEKGGGKGQEACLPRSIGRGMYEAKFYPDVNQSKIAQAIRMEGFDPLLISDPPGQIYPTHSHPEIKLLAFLRGRMEVKVDGKPYECRPGDKLLIPGNTEHSAVVGPEGCDFYWSEKFG